MILSREKVRGWLQLVRVPNLPTVPGDPLAGMLLAADADLGSLPAGRAAAVAAASVLIYAAGLAGNDVADIEEDRRDRPTRPLPSGAMAVRSAAIAAVVLTVAGVALAAWAGARAGTVAVVLAMVVILYNMRAKRSAWLGPLVMALCRALSLLMGVALAVDTVGTPRGLPFVAASALFVYIALVSILAREEVSPVAQVSTGEGGPGHQSRNPRPEPGAGDWKPWLPATGMACGFVLLLLLLAVWSHGMDRFALALGGIAAVGALSVCAMAGADKAQRHLPRTVGVWILCLVPMQAAWCLWSGHAAGLWAGAGLLLAWPLAVLTAKRFYAS